MKSVDIEISSVCNLKCVNCAYTDTHNLNKKFMKIEIFNNILKKIENIDNLRYIHLVGLGEATLHPKFIDFFKLIEKIKIKGIHIGITTNGTNISKYLAELSQFDNITISFDSATPDTFDKCRPGYDFFRLIEDVKKLSNKKKRVSFIINNYNFLEIEQFIDLAKELNATDVYYEFANEPWIKNNIFYNKSDIKLKIHKLKKSTNLNIILKEPPISGVCNYFDNVIKFNQDGTTSICPFINKKISLEEMTLYRKKITENINNMHYNECKKCNHFSIINNGINN